MKGVEFLTKSCDMNNATACFYLSGMHISGVHNNNNNNTTTTTSNAEVEKQLSKHTDKINANDNNNTTKLSSSSSLSTTPKTTTSNVAVKAKEFILQKDMSKAFNYAYKACELKNMYACANLSQMYARGDGTEKSAEKAEKFKKLALEMQEDIKKQKTLEFQQGLLT